VTLERETLHVMDDQQRIAQIDTRTLGNDGSPAQSRRYQLSNHLGSASVEVDEQANVISYEEYHPYGTTAYRAGRSAAEVRLTRYRYTGKEKDEETGLYYHGARYYACWLGRWTAADPIGLGDGVNRYAYVHGNPVNIQDPSGTQGIYDRFVELKTKAVEGLANIGETVEGGYAAVAKGLRGARKTAKEKTQEMVSSVAGETAGELAKGYVSVVTSPLEASATLGEAGGKALGAPLTAPKRLDTGVQKVAEGVDTDNPDLIVEGSVEAGVAAVEIAASIWGLRGLGGRLRRLGGEFGRIIKRGGASSATNNAAKTVEAPAKNGQKALPSSDLSAVNRRALNSKEAGFAQEVAEFRGSTISGARTTNQPAIDINIHGTGGSAGDLKHLDSVNPERLSNLVKDAAKRLKRHHCLKRAKRRSR
jgi:RHS repeat-associated protein